MFDTSDTRVFIGLTGLGCFIAAIVGGGIKVWGLQIPILPKWARLVLAIIGPALVVAAIANQALREGEEELLFTWNNKPALSASTPPPEQTDLVLTVCPGTS